MITIVSGPPGVGKTTIAQQLAVSASRGVHVESDEFYFFIPKLIAPSTAEATEQNATVITAAARAAAAYASGGYDVFLDGVLGPWYVPLLRDELGAFDYILLRAPLEDCVARVASRDAPGIEDVVRKMHGEFVDVGEFEGHVVETHGRTVDETLAEIARRRTAGDFALSAP